MLWLLGRYGNVKAKTFAAIACDIAESTLSQLPEGDSSAADCISTVRRWLKEEVSQDDVIRAAEAAKPSGAAYSAVKAIVTRAVMEAYWAAKGSRAAKESRAAYHATAAAEAAYYAFKVARAAKEPTRSADWTDETIAAVKAAGAASLQHSADICREYVVIKE